MTRQVRKVSARISKNLLRGVAQSRNFADMEAVAESGDLLSVGQVAEELNMAPRTVHYWITTGRIAATKLGPGTAQYVITRAEVERLKDAAA